MHTFTKKIAFLLAAALLLALLSGPALADVTKVKSLGDGSMEVRWDDTDAEELILVPDMGGTYESDKENFGTIPVDVEGKSKIVLYGMAPGQSYWLLTEDSSGNLSTPYHYKASKAPNFSEWKTTPSLSTFYLRQKDMNGKYSDVDYFLSEELEDANNYDSHGIRWRMDYPQLKKARSFLWQEVITDPDGFKAVVISGELELPAGRAYVYNDFMDIDEYLQTILEMRGEIPVGTYTFSVYWDGQHVCSATFRVR